MKKKSKPVNQEPVPGTGQFPQQNYDEFADERLEAELERVEATLSGLPQSSPESTLEKKSRQFFREKQKKIIKEIERRRRERKTGKVFPVSSPLSQRKAGKANALPLISSVDLLGDGADVATDWLVEGLLPKGSLVLLTAPPGFYKTFFALSLSVCVGEGDPFLSRSVEGGAVTYIDLENSARVLGARLGAIGTSPNLQFWLSVAEPQPPQLGSGFYRNLAQSSALIVFDSMRRFHSGNENAPEEMARVTHELRELARQGSTVLALHHSGKAEGNVYRGSTEILAGVDVAFSIEKERQQIRSAEAPVPLILRCIKHRYIPEPILNMELGKSGSRLSFRDITAEREQQKQQSTERALKSLQDLIAQFEKGGDLPKQSELILEAKEKLKIGKNSVLEMLREGESKFWAREARDGAVFYRTVSDLPQGVDGRKTGRTRKTKLAPVEE